MALLDWMAADSALMIEGAQVRLRPPRMNDFAEWAALRDCSREFLQPWEPTWAQDDLTRQAFRRRIGVYTRDIETGLGYPFFVFRAHDNALVGGVTLSNVRRGVAQAVTLGYWAGLPFVRQGHTLAAVQEVCAFAFRRLKLHRVEAACLPSNIPSRDLLLKAGFCLEGEARAYLKINGGWRDHLLFGLLEEDVRRGGSGA
jgi:ribosomal-protein-alanine N-acetyltransferase